jgi:hypothetical protein
MKWELIPKNQTNQPLERKLLGPSHPQDFSAHLQWCCRFSHLSPAPDVALDRSKIPTEDGALREEPVDLAKRCFPNCGCAASRGPAGIRKGTLQGGGFPSYELLKVEPMNTNSIYHQ